MKLLFPNDEHAPVALVDGTTLVGSDAACAIRLALPGIAAASLRDSSRDGGQTLVRPLTDSAATVLNGRQIAGEAAIKPGDLLLFGRIGCRVVSAGVAAPRTAPLAAVNEAGDDMGHTRVRMALPKYLLRGVSGPTFGKIYAVVGTIARRSQQRQRHLHSDRRDFAPARPAAKCAERHRRRGSGFGQRHVRQRQACAQADAAEHRRRSALRHRALPADVDGAGSATGCRGRCRCGASSWRARAAGLLVAVPPRSAALVVIVLGVLRYLGRI